MIRSNLNEKYNKMKDLLFGICGYLSEASYSLLPMIFCKENEIIRFI